MRRVDVVARRHDDVDAGRSGDTGERDRVTADPDRRDVDDRRAARAVEEVELRQRRALVGEEGVVEVAEVVVTDPAEVLERDRLVRAPSLGRLVRRLDQGRDVREEVLVRERDAHLARVDRPEHGLDLAGEIAHKPRR